MNLLLPFESLRWLSDQWLFLAGTVLALGCLSLFLFVRRNSDEQTLTRLRRFAASLRFPVFLLAARKLVLFMPLPGAISSADRVVFWSSSAYAYFLVVLTVYVLLFAAVRLRYLNQSELSADEANVWFWSCAVGYGILFGLSWRLLPVAEWSHTCTPILYLAAVLKVLMVSSLLLPLIWAGILAQALLWLLAGGVPGRELNKMLFLCVLICGCVENMAPPDFLGLRAMRSDIGGTWPAANPDNDRKTLDFLGVWAKKLPEINRTGINIVERNLPPGLAGRGSRFLAGAIPAPWPLLGATRIARSILGGCVALVVLMVALERLRVPKKQALNQAESSAVKG